MSNLGRRLIDASRLGDLDEVKSLIEQGADIHAYDDLASRWSFENGYYDVVELLLENGADIESSLKNIKIIRQFGTIQINISQKIKLILIICLLCLLHFLIYLKYLINSIAKMYEY